MMKLEQFGRIAALAIVAVSLSTTAFAEELSDAQMKAARAAIKATRVTVAFDNILPNIAGQVKGALIQASPNYEQAINETVDEKALEMAARRGDLEKEAAAIYAKTFTQEELEKITEFYNTPAGKKLLSDGPIAIRELSKAADIWAAGLSRDLSKVVNDALEAKIGAQAKDAAPIQQ
jgi:hypothetical protein